MKTRLLNENLSSVGVHIIKQAIYINPPAFIPTVGLKGDVLLLPWVSLAKQSNLLKTGSGHAVNPHKTWLARLYLLLW